MSGNYRAIVVGCGNMGKGWAGNIQKNDRSEVAAIVDLDIEKAHESAAKQDLPKDICRQNSMPCMPERVNPKSMLE